MTQDENFLLHLCAHRLRKFKALLTNCQKCSCLKMLRSLLLMLLCGVVSCSVTCPDKKMKCPDRQTCCFTERGYKCCPYPNAVCCADQAHCCPSGYMCDQTTQMCERGWDHRLLLLLSKDRAPQRLEPAALQEEQAPPSVEQAPPSVEQAPPSVDQAPPSVVYCDPYYTCPSGSSCCKYPDGRWWCCAYSPGWCCGDFFHCCPYGYNCDSTYTHCVRLGVPYPFNLRRPSGRPADPVDVPRLAGPSGLSAQPADPTLSPLEKEPAVQEGGSIRCDSQFYCPKGSSCCQDKDKKWNCCPYPLGICCADGRHCCQHGYTCDPTYNVCRS